MGASSREVKGLEDYLEYGQSGIRNVQVSHEALLDLIEIEPSLALMDGVPDVVPCLMMLGFRIEGHKTTAGVQKFNGWSKLPDHYMRCQHDKTKAYKTTVYGGMLRADYSNKGIYDDNGNYGGSLEREMNHPTLVSIASFNDHYRGNYSDKADNDNRYGNVEHTLHCDLGDS